MQFSVNFTVIKITIYLDNDVQSAQPTVLSVILVEKRYFINCMFENSYTYPFGNKGDCSVHVV